MVDLWRFSARWANPHTMPPGERILGSIEVPAGTPCPPWLSDLCTPGCGYAVCADFLSARPIRRWSAEAKAGARRRNLRRRLQRKVPPSADIFAEAEIARRPGYFAGES
ncbi:MAG TPA: theronine dehydrogenase [Inquilinus sp.]|nr:theronine dehydrogenase [Inquilinus sp.]